MLKQAIEKWVKSKPNLLNDITSCFQLFISETDIDVSRSHFFSIFTNLRRVQVIKTGGVYVRNDDLIQTIIQRSYFGIGMEKTISINEKPIINNNLNEIKCRVEKTHKGKIPSNKVTNFKSLEKLSNL